MFVSGRSHLAKSGRVAVEKNKNKNKSNGY